jgi:hypothetical protein
MAKRRGSGEGSIYRSGNRWVATITVDSTDGRHRNVSQDAWRVPRRSCPHVIYPPETANRAFGTLLTHCTPSEMNSYFKWSADRRMAGLVRSCV